MFGDVRLSVDSVDRKASLHVRESVDPTRVVVECHYYSTRGMAEIETSIELDRRAFLTWVNAILDGLL